MIACGIDPDLIARHHCGCSCHLVPSMEWRSADWPVALVGGYWKQLCDPCLSMMMEYEEWDTVLAADKQGKLTSAAPPHPLVARA